ncbi:MAG: tRNA (adenosine(37)-N6)-dimethylallyltransferase MiaA [Bacteroidota bacterium]
MLHHKYLIVVGGPTASGKTTLAIHLARYFITEILSCDSRQFFRELNIGTAKPNEDELAAAKHHFVGHLSIHDNYSVGEYEKEAMKVLDSIFLRHDVAIMVGGSGLYQKAVTEGLDEFPQVAVELRKKVELEYEEKGIEFLQKKLQKADPEYYKIVDINNPHRLIRALAVYEASGQPFSKFRTQEKQQRNFFPIYIEPWWDREVLYDRINLRVDLMMKKGLLEEAKGFLAHKALTPLQTVGYQELFPYFEGKYSLEEAIELIKRNTRRYAKRQLTWSRRDAFWQHFPQNAWKDCLEYIQLAMELELQWSKDEVHSAAYGAVSIFQLWSRKQLVGQIKRRGEKNYRYFELLLKTTNNRLQYHFLTELYYRLQTKDKIDLPDEWHNFFLEKGLERVDGATFSL